MTNKISKGLPSEAYTDKKFWAKEYYHNPI